MNDEADLPPPDAFDADRWCAFWLRIAGVVALAWFLLPIPGISYPSYLVEPWSWTWSHVSGYEPWPQVRLFFLPALGVLCLVLARPAMIPHRRRWLLIACGAALFLETVPRGARPLPELEAWGRNIMEELEYGFYQLAAVAIAAGCHLRWRYPDHRLGRVLAGAGGITLLASYFGFAGGLQYLADVWASVVPGAERDLEFVGFSAAFGAALVLAYGVIAATTLLPGSRARAQVCRWIARAYLVVAPLIGIAANLEWSADPSTEIRLTFVEAAVLSIRESAHWIAPAIVFASTVVVWLEPRREPSLGRPVD